MKTLLAIACMVPVIVLVGWTIKEWWSTEGGKGALLFLAGVCIITMSLLSFLYGCFLLLT